MRRIIASVNTTLDGFMEGPKGEGDLDWLMLFVPDGLADQSHMLAEEIDTILLGRVTYQGFTQYWPEQEGEFADLMNNPAKLVFASPGSLEEVVTWGKYDNARLIDRDVEEKVRDLKARDGKDMVILASGGLASSFLNLGLLDELRVGVVPVVLGAGKRYLRDITDRVELELSSSKSYPKGGDAPEVPRQEVAKAPPAVEAFNTRHAECGTERGGHAPLITRRAVWRPLQKRRTWPTCTASHRSTGRGGVAAERGTDPGARNRWTGPAHVLVGHDQRRRVPARDGDRRIVGRRRLLVPDG